MKKLLYVAVSFLSLTIIFAAGWASGVGTLNSKEEQPVALSKELIDEECPECPEEPEKPEEPECPECPEKREKPDFHRLPGRKIRIPMPPVDRDGNGRNPK